MEVIEKSAFVGLKIEKAFSSLTEFSCELQGEKGLLLQAVDSPNGPRLQVSTPLKADLPRGMDAVCRVDWDWICDSAIADAVVKPSSIRFDLAPAGPLTITVQVWQGKPFLAFQPYKAAK